MYRKNTHFCCGNHEVKRSDFLTDIIKRQLAQKEKDSEYVLEEDACQTLFSVGHRGFMDIYHKLTGYSHQAEPHYIVECDALI